MRKLLPIITIIISGCGSTGGLSWCRSSSVCDDPCASECSSCETGSVGSPVPPPTFKEPVASTPMVQAPAAEIPMIQGGVMGGAVIDGGVIEGSVVPTPATDPLGIPTETVPAPTPDPAT